MASAAPERPERILRIEERRAVPTASIVLGYGAMLPLAVAAVLAWTGPRLAPYGALAALWSGFLLAFLAGVRRGLSFRTPDGPRPGQLLASAALCVLALTALLASPRPWGLAAAALGFATLALVDPLAARHGAVPLHFLRLRPPQMTLAAVSVLVLLAAPDA